MPPPNAPPETARRPWALIAVVLAALGLAGWLVWRQYEASRPPPVPVVTEAPVVPAAPPSEPRAETGAPPVQHPLGEASAPLGAAGDPFAAALTELLGPGTVTRFLNLDGFARRAVATVDNLARSQAPSRLWPVQPTPGRFAPQRQAGEERVGGANVERYTPFVRVVEAMDAQAAVALYRRLYPGLQAAYEELGYPGRYFNDRLVQVIDHLLETPEPAEPPRLVLTDVKGPLSPTSPWLRYEFADPALESRSAGQKMLLRMGAAHARVLKAKLAEIRTLVATGGSTAR